MSGLINGLLFLFCVLHIRFFFRVTPVDHLLKSFPHGQLYMASFRGDMTVLRLSILGYILAFPDTLNGLNKRDKNITWLITGLVKISARIVHHQTKFLRTS